MERLDKRLSENQKTLDTLLGVGRSYDVISRDLTLGSRRGRMYVVDGYGDDGVIERMFSFLLGEEGAALDGPQDMQSFVDRFVTFCEVDVEDQIDKILTGAFLGKTVLLIDGMDRCALIDAKKFPVRGVEEPSDGRVLRGSHDGFVEALVTNTALLRRRIRSPHLTLENKKIGGRSQTDVVLAYMDDRVDQKLLAELQEKLDAIDVKSIAMSQESVSEAMQGLHPQWYNPFPKVRYTERPDVATACVMEGYIVLLVDNSPSVMLLPTHFFDFMEEANDYYFPPLVGTYLRYVRLVVVVLSLLLIPLWYLLAKSPHAVPDYLQFVLIEKEGHVPLLVQLLIVEFIVDLLKLASLNTPDVLSNSFSMIGALILGDFAVQARWLVPEVLVYMAFVAIASFVQPSFELGYAFKLLRMVLLLLIAAFDWWGLGAGLLLIAVLLFTTRPILGKGYMYPLWPFNWTALKRLLVRQPINKDNT